ncbi:amidohydrolase family protein [Arthrobacter sp. Sa2BUA2]|uniref:Amidohydrolase family protein n=1 Tax=Arthrobacter pullicola TaxID=2762224 RepID=A0ABR8YMH7_9MICC|nr:amidohydrolase family protein [Arthrobacter pullicola]MBD8045409.1 amidohydrolase family protein [Arthrobacter pullicola]
MTVNQAKPPHTPAQPSPAPGRAFAQAGPASGERVRTVLRGTVLRGPEARGDGVSGTQALADGAVVVDGEELSYVGPGAGVVTRPGDVIVELAAGEVMVPGLVDLHCHGGYGVDFSGADAHQARQAVEALHATGATTVMASLVTSAPQTLLRQLALLADLAEEGLVAGLHLEGPFLAEARCGAQDPKLLRDPDLGLAREFIGAARGQLRTMTYAPELPGADALVELLAENGVVPSLGHTACSPEAAAQSLALARQFLAASGVPQPAARPTVTHLFNGMDPMHHRAPGALSACLRAAKAGAAAVELIADNTHLDPYLVATMFDLLGAENIALVTDSMSAAGLADGQYQLGPAEVTVQQGVARLASTGSIAGGTATMLDLVRNTVAAGVSLTDAVTAAAAVPAGVLGRGQEIGVLAAGAAADLLVLGPGLEPARVMRRGRWLAPQLA